MAARSREKRVTGIGGVFFKAEDPKALARWYHRHLGIRIEGTMAIFAWKARKDARRTGHTIWSIFPTTSDYLGKG